MVPRGHHHSIPGPTRWPQTGDMEGLGQLPLCRTASWGLKVTVHHGTHFPPPLSYVPAGGEAKHAELLGWKRGHTAAGPQHAQLPRTAQHPHCHQDGDSSVPSKG